MPIVHLCLDWLWPDSATVLGTVPYYTTPHANSAKFIIKFVLEYILIFYTMYSTVLKYIDIVHYVDQMHIRTLYTEDSVQHTLKFSVQK